MATKPGIRWRDADKKKLAQVVRVFNAKRTREIKKNPDMINILPEKLSVAEVKENIKTRADYNYYVKQIQRFTKNKNATDIVTVPDWDKKKKVTRWERNEAKRDLRRANRNKQVKREEKDKGNPYAGNVPMYRPMTYPDQKNHLSKWDSFRKQMRKQASEGWTDSKEQQYKENYVESARTVYAEEDEEIFNEIAYIVSLLSPAQMVQALYDNPALELDYIYDEEDDMWSVSHVLQGWYKFLDNNKIKYKAGAGLTQ